MYEAELIDVGEMFVTTISEVSREAEMEVEAVQYLQSRREVFAMTYSNGLHKSAKISQGM